MNLVEKLVSLVLICFVCGVLYSISVTSIKYERDCVDFLCSSFAHVSGKIECNFVFGLEETDFSNKRNKKRVCFLEHIFYLFNKSDTKTCNFK